MMVETHYRMVFDVMSGDSAGWWFVLAGLAPICAALVILAARRWVPDLGWRGEGWLPFLLIVLGIAWMLGTFSTIHGARTGLRLALREGRFEVVEGTVTNFSPMPYEGHRDETFEVDGHRYAYSDYVLTQGFNNTASHGGPIREGLRVRIADVGGIIARLEIADDSAAADVVPSPSAGGDGGAR